MPRLVRLGKASARRVRKIYTTGLQPQATYGAEAWGISNKELLAHWSSREAGTSSSFRGGPPSERPLDP